MIYNVYTDITQGVRTRDLLRFVVISGSLHKNINSPYEMKKNTSGVWLADIISKTLQSHQSIDLSTDFTLHVQVISRVQGHGATKRKIVDAKQNLLKRNCVFSDKNPRLPNLPCFAIALYLALNGKAESNCGQVDFRTKLNDTATVESGVRRLMRQADLEYRNFETEESRTIDQSQFQRFQNIIQPKRLIVFEMRSKGELLFNGDTSGDPVVIMHDGDGDYFPILSLKAWFQKKGYCIDCEQTTNPYKHTCISKRMCKICKQRTCLNKQIENTFCDQCDGMFRNSICFDTHKREKICEQSSSCNDCGKWFPGPVQDHHCRLQVCPYCRKFVDQDHMCYIEKPVDAKQTKKSDPSYKYIYFDFECTQCDKDEDGKLQHKVNYAVAISRCSKCDKDTPCKKCQDVKKFTGLNGENVIANFCMWAFDSSSGNRNATFIAHCGGNYDFHFVMSHIVAQHVTPKLIMQGGKILQMTDPVMNTKWIDSFSFISIPLAQFPSTFGLGAISKGCFPHLFNVPDNYAYIGPLPDIKYYGADSMKESARERFIEWYQTHSDEVFNFENEIEQYCLDDVRILAEGCMAFREAFINDTGIDPFEQPTIASTCMRVFKTKFLQPNELGRIPVDGYRFSRNYSKSLMGWLT